MNDTLYSQIIPEPKVQFSPRHYICYRTDEPLNINGRLDENIWQKADWTDLFLDIEGSSKPSPKFKTRAKMLWDDKYFYIGAELEESDIWATLKERDTVLFFNNDFEVFIDPDGDTHNYYEFEINALNTVWDLLLIKPYRLGGPAVSAWDIQGLLSGVNINGTLNKPGDKDLNWTVEIAFPWNVLMQCAGHKGIPKHAEQWRLNFSRVEWSLDTSGGKYNYEINPKTKKPYLPDNWVWSPQGLIDMHYPEMWGYVQFSQNIAGTEKDDFIKRPEEYAKWICRRIFYKESAYYSRHGKYTTRLNELGIKKEDVPGYLWPPKIETASGYFEVYMISLDGKKKTSVSSSGKTL